MYSEGIRCEYAGFLAYVRHYAAGHYLRCLYTSRFYLRYLFIIPNASRPIVNDAINKVNSVLGLKSVGKICDKIIAVNEVAVAHMITSIIRSFVSIY